PLSRVEEKSPYTFRTVASPSLAISSNSPSTILAEVLSASIRTARRRGRSLAMAGLLGDPQNLARRARLGIDAYPRCHHPPPAHAPLRQAPCRQVRRRRAAGRAARRAPVPALGGPCRRARRRGRLGQLDIPARRQPQG